MLVVGCFTSDKESLVTVELLPETTADLVSMATAVLTDGLTDVELTVVTAVTIPLVFV